MEQIDAIRLLAKEGILSRDQLESFQCGSEHYPEKVWRVLDLAEIVFPEGFGDTQSTALT